MTLQDDGFTVHFSDLLSVKMMASSVATDAYVVYANPMGQGGLYFYPYVAPVDSTTKYVVSGDVYKVDDNSANVIYTVSKPGAVAQGLRVANDNIGFKVRAA